VREGPKRAELVLRNNSVAVGVDKSMQQARIHVRLALVDEEIKIAEKKSVIR
jgi:hypothetical protein